MTTALDNGLFRFQVLWPQLISAGLFRGYVREYECLSRVRNWYTLLYPALYVNNIIILYTIYMLKFIHNIYQCSYI